MTDKLVVEWLLSDDTGVSSKAMVSAFYGMTVSAFDYPRDPDDLGRCLRLLRNIPNIQLAFGELAHKSPGWNGILLNLTEIKRCMEDEVGIDWDKAKRAPKTYNLMKDAIGRGFKIAPDWECIFDKNGHLCSARKKENNND